MLAAGREARHRITRDGRVLALLDAVRAVHLGALARDVECRPLMSTVDELLDYLHATMAHRMTESARVLHLNTRNLLIRDEMVSEGSIDQASIHVREVARRALELGSAAIILVHNHPSGDPAPSRQDIALTREIVLALKPLGIQVHDHLIIGATGHASLRALGLL